MTTLAKVGSTPEHILQIYPFFGHLSLNLASEDKKLLDNHNEFLVSEYMECTSLFRLLSTRNWLHEH